jgi:hypothetical protein
MLLATITVGRAGGQTSAHMLHALLHFLNPQLFDGRVA